MVSQNMKIAGGFLVAILFFFTLEPFNDTIQGLASAPAANIVLIVIAQIYDILHVSLTFIILAFVIVEVAKSAK